MQLHLLGLALLTYACSYAQRECGTYDYVERLKASGRAVAASIERADAFSLQKKPGTAGTSRILAADAVVRIPVVVHILYKFPSQNLSDAQIRSQIAALNRDFRRKNRDTLNTPAPFKGLGADIAIEFELARVDPNGAPTTGIIRKQTGVDEWTNDDRIKFSSRGGDGAWDSESYLNIWVGNMRRLLGYSSVPGSPAEVDGIVISTAAFGTLNRAGPYSEGRTAVHEAGHWLGLKHIWGDTYCGDDGVDDTPPQGNYTPGCPTGFRSSCSNGERGDMYMNYMDFTYDACVNLFTEGQKSRMRAVFEPDGPRAILLESRGLGDTWSNDRKLPAEMTKGPEGLQLSFYPNPVTHFLTVEIKGDTGLRGKELRICGGNGFVLRRVVLHAEVQKLDVSTLPKGIYIVEGETTGQRFARTFVKL